MGDTDTLYESQLMHCGTVDIGSIIRTALNVTRDNTQIQVVAYVYVPYLKHDMALVRFFLVRALD